MTTRTFRQFGQAYGATPASITASVGGSVVFSGAISTADQPVPLSQANISAAELFSWINTVDFAGNVSFSIAVNNSQLLLTDTDADYCSANNTSNFYPFYSYEDSGMTIADPFTDVTIDGVPMLRGPNNSNVAGPLTGQWYWLIPAGSTFTATLNVSAGQEPSTP
jgi:hypothetical protein